ncbi:WD domain, g-beta repeat domain-containing protein [Pochonia chlamydosporia 170]|uniref:WD domain, g-beta repeat domain-containing protein n=1 Tax=Pochonia chlamydosporia 170 TaxID=1380566 RepID=A0A179F545_METCM|nr:WD domain, g-beta repeat domain-containing protein [Pochonia chlamydosporia 170]OAQ60293.1 WD domain, g-beta repeat domain-containing protein [Pochonia chlamydosporia 170]
MKVPKVKSKATSPQWAVCCNCGLEKNIGEFQFSQKDHPTPKNRAWWKLVTSKPTPKRYRCVKPPAPCPKLNQLLLPAAPVLEDADTTIREAQADLTNGLKVQQTDPTVAVPEHGQNHTPVTQVQDTKQEAESVGQLESPKPDFSPAGHTAAVCTVVFSPDGNTVYSASKDRTVCEWDPFSKMIRRTIRHHVATVADVAVSSATGSAAWALFGNRIEIRDVDEASSYPVKRSHGAESWISAVSYSWDNRYVAYGSDDKFVRVLDLEANQLKWKEKRHEGYISCIAFSNDGSRLASGSVDSSIQIWDLESGYGVGTLNTRDGCARAVAFSPDASVLATGCGKTICLWNLQKLKVSMRLKKHYDSVNALAFSPSGRQLASASADRTIVLWDVVSGQLLRQISAHSGEVLTISFSPDGKMVASGSEDCTVKMWPVAECEAPQTGTTLADELGAGTSDEEKASPGLKKASTTKVSTKRNSNASDAPIYSSLAAAGESEASKCYLCLGFTDGRNTSERCVCWK